MARTKFDLILISSQNTAKITEKLKMASAVNCSASRINESRHTTAAILLLNRLTHSSQTWLKSIEILIGFI
jgi:hypothetical protein